MDEPISNVVWVVVCSRKPEVRLLVYPDGKWVPVCHQDPLSDVKLSFFDNQRVFNILLCNPLAFFVFANVKDLNESVVENNASTTGKTCRFDYPDITLSIQSKLRKLLFQDFEDLDCLSKQRVLFPNNSVQIFLLFNFALFILFILSNLFFLFLLLLLLFAFFLRLFSIGLFGSNFGQPLVMLLLSKCITVHFIGA